ncbi:MAG: HipA family kinase [Chloroflexota bacterium]
MLRRVTATRYVTPFREGGSVPALMEADDDGMYVVKFRGAGQGPKALVAEIVAGELARRLDLPVPEIVLVDLDPALGRAEPDVEIQELLERSAGTNVGLDFLPGSLPFDAAAGSPPAPELAAAIAWFDALVTNVDRSPRNVNLLVWHGRLHLIDHGAALYVQHTWRDPDEHARRSFPPIRDHVLLPYATSIAASDEALADRLDERTIADVVDLVPDDLLGDALFPDIATERRAYVDYLVRRLEPPRPFVEEADRARAA